MIYFLKRVCMLCHKADTSLIGIPVLLSGTGATVTVLSFLPAGSPPWPSELVSLACRRPHVLRAICCLKGRSGSRFPVYLSQVVSTLIQDQAILGVIPFSAAARIDSMSVPGTEASDDERSRTDGFASFGDFLPILVPDGGDKCPGLIPRQLELN